MMRTFFFSAMLLLTATTSLAQTPGASLDNYRKGLLLSQVGNFAFAAEHWRDAARVAMETPVPGAGATETKRDETALFLTFAAISYERADDARAYAAWTDALNAYFSEGDVWEREREALRREIDDIQYSVNTSFFSEGASISKDNETLLLLSSLDKIIHFTSYAGPRPNLTVRTDQSAQETITAAHAFFPKPKRAAGEEDAGMEPNRSRAGGDEDALNAGVASNGIARTIPLPAGSQPSDASGAPGAAQAPDIIAIASPSVAVETASLPEPPIAAAPTAAPLDAAPSSAEARTPEPARAGTLAREFFEDHTALPQPRQHAHNAATSLLTDEDLEISRRAWRYFKTNFQSNTGLFNSVDQYTYTTMWDLGSMLAALHSAHLLGVIDDNTFTTHLERLLKTLSEMPLYDNVLPNREYDTRSAAMTDLSNRTSAEGSGYSAIDIGRLLVWLYIIRDEHDGFANQVNAVVERWDLSRLIEHGEFYREIYVNGAVDRRQEGRFGYEQYAALALALWDVVAINAIDDHETVDALVDATPIKVDTREPSFLNSEPFLLVRLEFANRPASVDRQGVALLQAHDDRFERTGVISAYSEDSMDRAPWFLYNMVSDGETSWLCKTHRGERRDACQILSTKAALAYHALFDSPYTARLREAVIDNHDARKGYYAGFYDSETPNKALNANTNAVILTSMAFKKRGGEAFVNNALKDRQAQSRSRLAN